MATLLFSGTLVSAGGLPAQGRFNYGLTAALGTFTPFQGPLVAGQTFTDTVGSLPGQVLIFYRAEAQNALGLVVGATLSIRTKLSLTGTVEPACGTLGGTRSSVAPVLPPVPPSPPSPGTLSATEIGGGSAQLNGIVIDDMGIGVEASFEWGGTPAYGQETPWVSGYVTGDVFSQVIAGLRPASVYHFRARVRNRFGVGLGGNVSFNTSAEEGSRTGLSMELALLTMEEI